METCKNVRLYVWLRGTSCRVRGVSACRPCSVCVLFHGRCVARGLTALAFASTPSNERHTIQPLRAARPGSQATCSPLACLGTKAASARCLNPCRADRLAAVRRTLLYAVHCCTPYRPMPEVVVALETLAGCIPSHLVAPKTLAG